MSYTALRSSSSGNLGGLRYPVNYGSGEVFVDKVFTVHEYMFNLLIDKHQVLSGPMGSWKIMIIQSYNWAYG
jgi:hypothetical protein